MIINLTRKKCDCHSLYLLSLLFVTLNKAANLTLEPDVPTDVSAHTVKVDSEKAPTSTSIDNWNKKKYQRLKHWYKF
jgi:hypothetical protein